MKSGVNKLLFFSLFIIFILSISFVSAGNGYGGKGLENRLVGNYKLDGNANDSSYNKIHGTALNGPTTIANRFGESGKALNFDGANDYVSIPNNPAQGLTPWGFTTAGWFYIDNINGDSRLIAKEDATTVTFRTFIQGGNLFFQTNSNNGIITQTQGSLSGYNGQWVFIASNYDQNRLNLYIARQTDTALRLLNSATIGGTTDPVLFVTSANYGIGARGNGGNYFDGRIDDVKIYDRTLSRDELNALFLLGKDNNPATGLILHMPLDDSNPANIQDFSPESPPNNGFGSGVISQNGKLGKSYKFDGVNDYIYIEDSEERFTSDFNPVNITVSAWVSLNLTDSQHYDHIVTKRACDVAPCTADPNNFQWSLQTDANPASPDYGRYVFGVLRTGESVPVWAPGAKITPYKWTHVVGVYDGRNLSIYIDGILEGRQSYAQYKNITSHRDNPSISNIPVFLGARSAASGGTVVFPMDGALDEVRVYNRALNPAEVWELYRNTPLEIKSNTINPLPTTYDPTVGYTYADITSANGRTQLIQGERIMSSVDGVNYNYNPTATIYGNGIPSNFNLSYGIYFSWVSANSVSAGLKWLGREGTNARFYTASSGGAFTQYTPYPFASGTDVVRTGWYHGTAGTDGPRLSLITNAGNQRGYTAGTGAFSTEVSFLTNPPSGLPAQIPNSSYWYRFSTCRFISATPDVDKNSIVNAADRTAISNIVGTPYAYGGCEDLDGNGIVNTTDIVIMDDALTGLNNGFHRLLPKNAELHIWYTTPVTGEAQVYSWDGNSTSPQYTSITTQISGLPLTKGAPRLAYYDDLTERIIAWYRNSAYESADGRNFRLFIGPGAEACTQDADCLGTGYCNRASGQCIPYTCTPPANGCTTSTRKECTSSTVLETVGNVGLCVAGGEGNPNSCQNFPPINIPLNCIQFDDIGGCINNPIPTGDDHCAICNDGIREGLEPCDDGNMLNNDLCTTLCQITTCGDGVRQTPNGQGLTEACDSGVNNGLPGFCKTDCTGLVPSNCGNGVQEAGETCDDNNLENKDMCPNSCLIATCGDGIVRTLGANPEACDDGNTNNNDGCSSSCVVEPGYTCTPISVDPTVCEPIKLGLCSNLDNQANCEDSSFWEYELLSAIEIVHEAFADANELDRDFCTNNQSDNAECGCKWAPATSECIEFVWYDKNDDNLVTPGEQCFAQFDTEQLQGGVCDGTTTEYTIGWTSYNDVGTSILGDSEIGCVPGSKTFQCPVSVSLPFFTLANLIIAIISIFAIYAIIYYGKKRK